MDRSQRLQVCGPLYSLSLSVFAHFVSSFFPSAFETAWSIFGSTGIVLSLRNTNFAHPFFDGNFWSCFQNEDEKLFLGGFTPFTFNCIRNIPKSQKFSKSTKIINILREMLLGYPLPGIKPVPSDVSRMSLMIKAELDAVYLDDPYTGKLPLYTVHLFHQFLCSKTEIVINWKWMDMDFWYHDPGLGCNVYGFKKCRNLFVSENGSGSLQMSSLVNLCENIKSMVVMSQPGMEYIPSIALDDGFLTEILSSIKSLNDRGNRKFKEFVIVKPSDSISEFIKLNQQRFSKMGWTLKEEKYAVPGRAGKATKSLWIIRN